MKKTKTPEQDAADKARFDWLRANKITGQSKRMNCAFSGKNKAQRERLKSGFDATMSMKRGGDRVRFLTK